MYPPHIAHFVLPPPILPPYIPTIRHRFKKLLCLALPLFLAAVFFNVGLLFGLRFPPAPAPASWQIPPTLKAPRTTTAPSPLTVPPDPNSTSPPENNPTDTPGRDSFALLWKDIQKLAATAPRAAIDQARAQAPSPRQLASLFNVIARQWTESDPAAALAWAHALPAALRPDACAGVLNTLTYNDHPLALELYHAIAPEDRFLAMATDLVRYTFRSGSLENSLAVLNSTDPELVKTAYFNLDEFAAYYPDQALDLLTATPENLQDWRIEELVPKIRAQSKIEQDLESTLAAATDPWKNQTLLPSLRFLARKNLPAALEIIARQDDPTASLYLAPIIAETASRIGARSASAYHKLVAQTLADIRHAFPQSLPSGSVLPLLELTKATPEEPTVADQIFGQLSRPGTPVDRDFHRTLSHLASLAPDRTASLAQALIDGEWQTPGSIDPVRLFASIHHSIDRNPEQITLLASRFAPNPDHSRVIDLLLARASPEQAHHIAARVDPLQLAPLSHRRLAELHLHDDPEKSFDHATRSGDPGTIASALRVWAVRDPTAAHAALDTLTSTQPEYHPVRHLLPAR